MSTTQFDSRRKPRQAPFPAFPDVPVRLQEANPAPATPSSTGLSTGFFTPSAVAVEPEFTLTASSASPAPVVAEPTPVPEVAEVAGAEVAALPPTVTPAVDMDAAPPLVTTSAAASATEGTIVEENAAVSMSPGGIAMGSIAGVAFFVSLIFLLYKWRRGTLPQALQSATRALKFRSSKPAAPEADTMEKGLTSSAASIRSESASIHSISSLTSTFSVSTVKSSLASLKRSVSVASSRAGDKGISGPSAFEGQQADKLAVPLPLHLARLEAAGLWTADAATQRVSAGEIPRMADVGTAEVGKMDPSPVVEEPDVHPLRAHRVQPEGDRQASWPLSS